MHITPEVLHGFAKRYVEKRVEAERSIIAAYLRGSLLSGSPLLGGTGDIDIVFIHTSPPEIEREIKRLTPEIHYDIEHHDQLLYREPRQLRVHPWLGPTLYNAKKLYDPQHFLAYIQAGVRGQFSEPDHVLQRAKTELESARRFWLDHQLNPPQAGPEEIKGYLKAVEQAVNVINLLSGTPLATRRLGLEFPERAILVKHPKLYQGFLGLLGGATISIEVLREWLTFWTESLDSLPPDVCPINLHPHRKAYYHQSLASLLGSEQPKSMLWPLLKTWTQAVSALPNDHITTSNWKQACNELGLCGENFANRLEAFDVYLDRIEEIFNNWNIEQGAG